LMRAAGRCVLRDGSEFDIEICARLFPGSMSLPLVTRIEVPGPVGVDPLVGPTTCRSMAVELVSRVLSRMDGPTRS